MVSASDAQTSHQPIASIDLPAFPLAISEADGWIVASLGLSGVAFVQSDFSETEPTVLSYPEWQTLSVTDLPGPSALFAGRDGVLRTIVCDPPGSEPVLLSEWRVEGVPNQAAFHDGTLVLATGGVGVSIWSWPDPTAAPTLRGRYPFVEFARRIAIEPEAQRLYVADSIGGRLAILDIADPTRPHLIESYPVPSFCDSVDLSDHFLAFTDRKTGAFLARRSPTNTAGNLWVLHKQMHLIHPYHEEIDAKRVLLSPREDAVFLCEEGDGVRHWRIKSQTGVLEQVAHYQTRGGAMDAVILSTGHLVVADHPHGLSVFVIASDPESR